MTDQPTKTRPGDQPLPVGGQECVQDALIAKIEERKRLGVQRYGSVLMTHNGRDAGRDMVEEAVDLAVYAMQVAMELSDLRAAIERVRAIKRAPSRSEFNTLANAQDNGWDAALFEVQRALEATPALDTPADNSGPTIPNHQVNEGEPADSELDTCRPVEVDGEMIRVRGAGDFSEESHAAVAEVVRAARRKMINEQRAAMAKYPYEDGDVTVLGPEIFADATGKVISWKGANFVPQNRLRLAHEARRRKEGMLDGIRRALCDVGLMEDDDPYGHADLEDVIRQNGRALAEAAGDPAATEATEPYPPIGHTGDQT